MSKSTDKRFQTLDKLFDELLGPLEGWSRAELDGVLADAGVDLEATDRVIFERVSEIAGSYRQRNRDVPSPVADFLRQMRPAELLTGDGETAKMSARKWIARLRRLAPIVGTPEFAYAFRNKKDQLTPKDRALLDALENKLRNRKRNDEV